MLMISAKTISLVVAYDLGLFHLIQNLAHLTGQRHRAKRFLQESRFTSLRFTSLRSTPHRFGLIPAIRHPPVGPNQETFILKAAPGKFDPDPPSVSLKTSQGLIEHILQDHRQLRIGQRDPLLSQVRHPTDQRNQPA
jgi:hypothetical protein